MDRVLETSFLVKHKQRTNMGMIMQKSFETSTCGANLDHWTMKRGKRKEEKFIDLMFYKPLDTDVFLNRIVAYATKEKEYRETGEVLYAEFAHVEISFKVTPKNEEFEEKMCMGFSITQKSNVFFKLRTWRPEYKPIRINVSDSIYEKLYQTCTLLAMQKIKFDKFAMYSAIVAPPMILQNRDRQTYGTYCSKIITEVLQQYKIGPKPLLDLTPYTSTPSLLYKCLKNQDG